MSGFGIGFGLRQARHSLLTAATRSTLAASRGSSCSVCGQCQGASGSKASSHFAFARLQSTSTDAAKAPAIHAFDESPSHPGPESASVTDKGLATPADSSTSASPEPSRQSVDNGKARQPTHDEILEELETWARTRARLAIKHPYLNGPQLSLLAHIITALDQARRTHKYPPPAQLVRTHDELLESAPDGQSCEPSSTTFAVLLRYAYRQGDAATLKDLSYHATKWYQADARAKAAQQTANSPPPQSQPPQAAPLTQSGEGAETEVDLLALIHNLGMAHRTRGGRRTLSVRMLRVREASLQERRRGASLANQDLQMRFAYNQLLNPRGLPLYREGKVAKGEEGAGNKSDSPFETEVSSRSALARTRYSRLHVSRSRLKLMRELARSEGSRIARSASRAPGGAQDQASNSGGAATTDALLDRWQARLAVRDRRRSAAESEVREMIIRLRDEAGDRPVGVPAWLLLSALRRRAEQGSPREAKSLVASYMKSLREAGRVEGRTLPNPSRVYAVSNPDRPPAGASLLNLVLRAHLVAGHSLERMLQTTEQMTAKRGLKEKILARVGKEVVEPTERKPKAKGAAAATAIAATTPKKAPEASPGAPHATDSGEAMLPIDADADAGEVRDVETFEYRVVPNETTVLLLLEGARQRRQRVQLGTSIVRQAMYTWMPSGKGGTRASSTSARASRPLELTTATARTLLSWALRERRDAVKLARGVLSLHKRYRELEGRRARHLAGEGKGRERIQLKPRRGGELSKWRRTLWKAVKAKVISLHHFEKIC